MLGLGGNKTVTLKLTHLMGLYLGLSLSLLPKKLDEEGAKKLVEGARPEHKDVLEEMARILQMLPLAIPAEDMAELITALQTGTDYTAKEVIPEETIANVIPKVLLADLLEIVVKDNAELVKFGDIEDKDLVSEAKHKLKVINGVKNFLG